MVVFAPSLAGQTITLSTGALAINSNITINGSAAPGLTVSGGSTSQIFVVSSGTVAIDNLNLTNGLAQGGNGGSPSNSSGGGGGGGAGLGGAIELLGGSLTLTSDKLSSNQAVGGTGGSISGNFPNVNAGAGGGPAGGTAGIGSTTGNGTNGGNGGAFSGGGGGGGTYGAYGSPTPGNGGTGGFGGGGGGAGGSPFGGNGGTGASGGTLGGNGGNAVSSGSGGGGGGAGLGGAVFVNTGATLSLVDTSLTGDSVTAGQGGGAYDAGTNGSALGSGLFLTGGTTSITLSAGSSQTISDEIAELPSSGSAISINGTGALVLSGANTYTGGTTVNGGTLQFGQTVSMPASGTVTVNSGATLAVNAGGSGEFTDATSGAGSLGGIFSGIGGQGAPVVLDAGSIVGIDTTNAGGTLTYSGDITNAGVGLTKLGTGTLLLTGTNSYSGGTTISAGTLAVGNSAALGSGAVAVNGGMLATDGVNHLITVGGNYSQGANGTLSIRIYSATANDTVAANGSAALGGNLILDFSNFTNATRGLTYTVLTANGGITGNFSDVETVSLSPTLKVVATIDTTSNPNAVIVDTSLIQMPFASVSGLNPNQVAVAANIDSVSTTSTNPGFIKLVGGLNTVSGNSQSLASSLNELMPINFANFASSTAFNNIGFTVQQFDDYLSNHRSADGTFVSSQGGIDYTGLAINDPNVDPGLQSVRSRLLAWSPAPSTGLLSDSGDPVLGGVDMKDVAVPTAPANRWNVFIDGNVVLAQDFSNPSAGLPYNSATTGAVQIGADYKITPHFLAGVTFGYGHTYVTLDNIGSDANVDTYSPGVYLSYASNGWYANAIGTYGFTNYSQDRSVDIGAFSGTAHSSPSGDQIVGDLDGGYDFHEGNWTLGPTLGVQYVHLDVDGYTETGLSGADLTVNQDEADSLRSRFGGQVSCAVKSGDTIFTPHLSASWQHEFLDQSRGITSQFSDVGAGSFVVDTANPSRDSALVDVGLDAQINNALTVFTDYSAQAGQSNYFGQSVQAGVKIGF